MEEPLRQESPTTFHAKTSDRGQIDLGISKHKTVAEAWEGYRQRRHRSTHLQAIETALLQQRNDRTEDEDIVLWKGKNDVYKPQFLTKETLNHMRTISMDVDWYKGVWFGHSTPKYSFCVWLAVLNRLSTGDRMTHWNGGQSAACVLCHNAPETRDHLFFSCDFASIVWSNLARGIYGDRFSTHWQDLIQAISGSWMTPLDSFFARYLFQATVHTIWRERNGRNHGEKPNSAALLIK
ncbi:F15O4.34 [Arabidopsis thaliana]|uniref:F15O4.34 n=1 Tax=Arabidopsis thaliana TaxID=3702 RepID=Q9LQF1_ARATH|nr:F15O4.34 [Arabidopsis thaliana]